MTEIWKPLPEYENRYEVSSIGRLRVIGIDQVGRKRYMGRILAVKYNKWGYLRYFLSKDGKKKNMTAHRAVCAAFIGPCPPGLCVNHKNGIKDDNRIENLEYVTHVENAQHNLNVLGWRPVSGYAHCHAVLTDEQVREVRRRALAGERHKDLASEFGCTAASVSLWRNKLSRPSAFK